MAGGRTPVCGFTLLELLVVVTVLAMVSMVVVTRFGDAQHGAAFGQALARWEFVDEQMRSPARRLRRPVELRLELGTGRLTRTMEAAGRDDRIVQSLGSQVSVERYVSATRDVNMGRVVVAYTPYGTTESFAVKLAGPGGKEQWLLVAGVSGQVIPFGRDTEVRDVLQTLRPDGLHTR